MTRDNDLAGKVFAISGGASGIGLSCARILLSRGASIGIGDIDPTALDAASKSLQPADRVVVSKLDVSKRASVESWIRDVLGKFGKLDGAANCAGVIGKHHGTRGVEELEDEQWDLIMGVNLTGMFCLAFCLLKSLIWSFDPRGRGRVMSRGDIDG